MGNDWKWMKMIWKGVENKALKSNASLNQTHHWIKHIIKSNASLNQTHHYNKIKTHHHYKIR